MSIRIATGSQLPKGWTPGTPLTVGKEVAPWIADLSGCPFGPQCYSCRNGLRWDAIMGKHREQGESAHRPPLRSQPRARRRLHGRGARHTEAR